MNKPLQERVLKQRYRKKETEDCSLLMNKVKSQQQELKFYVLILPIKKPIDRHISAMLTFCSTESGNSIGIYAYNGVIKAAVPYDY